MEGVAIMDTARISVNIDKEVKQNALRVLGEIGMDMTTAIDTFLRTIVREERIPFNLRTERAYKEAAHREYIMAELDRAKREAADPNTRWMSQDEMMARLKLQREARKSVSA
jgi:DNA-damage-inducible protein J